jgi:hypothetical protein
MCHTVAISVAAKAVVASAESVSAFRHFRRGPKVLHALRAFARAFARATKRSGRRPVRAIAIKQT